MNKILLFIYSLFLLIACHDEEMDKTMPQSILFQSKVVDLDTNEGYKYNPITMDSIDPVIRKNGDTLLSGVSIPAIGIKIDIDKSNLKSVKLTTPNSTIEAHPNVHEITTELKVIPVDIDSLKNVFILENTRNDFSESALTEIDETSTSRISSPVQGKTTPIIQPHPVKALPPMSKNDAIYGIQYLDVDQGMSSSYIYSTLEDKNGNLWFGTNGLGVNKYDGESFTHFTEREGLSSNTVLSILEDKNGDLWFGTDAGGACKYDGKSFTHFTKEEGLLNNTVWSMLEDKSGNLWFGTYGGGVSMYNGNTFTHFTENEGLSNNIVLSILEDREGNIWFGTEGGGVNRYDGNGFTYFSENEGLLNNTVWTMLEDRNGNIWFGTSSGICKYDGSSFTYLTEKDGLSSNYIWSIQEDKKGDIWFGTMGGGVSRYNGESFTHFTEKEGMTNNTVLSILEDESGNLWFGTKGGGVNIYKNKTFEHFTQNEGIPSNVVWSALEDKNENLWFGTDAGGISKYNGKSFTHFTEKEGFTNSIVLSIIEDKSGNLWFGTDGGGVFMYNGETITQYTHKNGLSNDYVWYILEDTHENIWFATEGGGVSKFDGKTFTNFTENEGLSSNSVKAIAEDKDGMLWFGTNGGGITKYDGEYFTHFTEQEGLSSNEVTCILEDDHGVLWFGTVGAGISKFNGNSFEYITTNEGLSSDYIWSIIEVRNGTIWVSTENGLNELEIVNNEDSEKAQYNIKNFGKNDGLKGVDFYANSVCLDAKDRIWWGSGKSLTMLDLNNHTIAENSPKAYLKHLLIDENFIDYRNIDEDLNNQIKFSKVPNFGNYPLNLELPYDKNHLTFEFIAIDWYAPKRIQYSYVMEGLNSNWSKPSTESKLDFKDLTYGTYTLKVRVIGESGEWNDGFDYKFIIHPPWWHTWWARTSYIVITILLILGFLRWRILKLKKRQIELEDEIKLATKEIRKQKNEAEEQRDEIERQKVIVEIAHTEITDSINYAKRIQNAILPPLKLIKKHLPSSFVIYKPKNVVAGDFYWLTPFESTTVSGEMDKGILFAAADCTGHGVPGAIVSVVCNNGLNRSIREYKLTEPSEILNKTREIVIGEFDKGEHDVQDGMDIALCSLTGNKLQYSGANNPLWIVRNGALIEIKATKQPIGKFDKLMPYVSHNIDLQKGDTIYIFSDGYVDQFGGLKGKKFKKEAFKKLILSVQDMTMEEQSEIIDKVFEDWKGDLEQVDDVCVIGVKIES